MEAKEGGGLSLNWERTLLEGMASGATEAPMVEGPPPQPADDAACVHIRVLGLSEEKLI